MPVAFFMAAAPRKSARLLEQAANQCEHWAILASGDWVPVVALALPAALADDLHAWAVAARLAPHLTSDDANVGAWAAARGLQVHATVPSLVQHDDAAPSLMGNYHGFTRNPNRYAVCWIGDHDGREICW